MKLHLFLILFLVFNTMAEQIDKDITTSDTKKNNKRIPNLKYLDGYYIPFSINGKWGYIDNKGKILIKPQFDKAGLFNEEGYAVVTKNGQSMFINKKGEKSNYQQKRRLTIKLINDNGEKKVYLKGKKWPIIPFYKLMEKLAEMNENRPILFLIGDGISKEDPVIKKCKEMGFTDIVITPFSFDNLYNEGNNINRSIPTIIKKSASTDKKGGKNKIEKD